MESKADILKRERIEKIKALPRDERELRTALIQCFHNILETTAPWSRWKSPRGISKEDFQQFDVSDFTYPDSHFSLILKHLKNHLTRTTESLTKEKLVKDIEWIVKANQENEPSTIGYVYMEEQDSYGRNWHEDAFDLDWLQYLDTAPVLEASHRYQTKHLNQGKMASLPKKPRKQIPVI